MWNMLSEDPDNLPRPNEWVLVYQRYSKPNYTIGRLHFEMLDNGCYRNYWEWFDNNTIGKPLICPGTEYVCGWMDIPKVSTNAVDHPDHYNQPGHRECIDEMLDQFGVEAVRYFCLLNRFKYLYRHNMKNGDEDLQKADWYESHFLSYGGDPEELAVLPDNYRNPDSGQGGGFLKVGDTIQCHDIDDMIDTMTELAKAMDIQSDWDPEETKQGKWILHITEVKNNDQD